MLYHNIKFQMPTNKTNVEFEDLRKTINGVMRCYSSCPCINNFASNIISNQWKLPNNLNRNINKVNRFTQVYLNDNSCHPLLRESHPFLDSKLFKKTVDPPVLKFSMDSTKRKNK